MLYSMFFPKGCCTCFNIYIIITYRILIPPHGSFFKWGLQLTGVEIFLQPAFRRNIFQRKDLIPPLHVNFDWWVSESTSNWCLSTLTWGANVQREGLDKYISAVVCHTPTIAISSAYVGWSLVADVNILFGWIGWAHFGWDLDFSDLFGCFLLDVQDSRPCVACLYRRKKGPSKSLGPLGPLGLRFSNRVVGGLLMMVMYDSVSMQ